VLETVAAPQQVHCLVAFGQEIHVREPHLMSFVLAHRGIIAAQGDAGDVMVTTISHEIQEVSWPTAEIQHAGVLGQAQGIYESLYGISRAGLVHGAGALALDLALYVIEIEFEFELVGHDHARI